MSTRRLWYVLPLDIAADDAAPALMVDEAQQQPAEAGVDFNEVMLRVDNGRQNNPRRPARAIVQQPPRGMVFKINAAGRKEFTAACTTEEMAIQYARERAVKEPKRPFGIFSCISVVETMEPTCINKEFNDAGELRIKQEVQQNA